ncbi:MAG: hypothetical protein ACFFFG_15185 [Candidatus Thorarchaeota archaeon]
MSKKSGQKPSQRVRFLNGPRKILKFWCHTPIAKPLNGAAPKSKSSYMLKLVPVSYSYEGNAKVNGKTQKVTKTSTADSYLIKGLRGALRHKVMALCYEAGLDVCHTSDKLEDKHQNSLIPPGFHPLGECATNGESCIIHQIFGSIRHASIISVSAPPIIRFIEKSAQLTATVQQVHMATENRTCMSFDQRPIQDFSESYLSGTFAFEVDVTLCTPEQLGLLIEAGYQLEKLGRGYNSGYGHLYVRKFQLHRKTKKRVIKTVKEEFVVHEQVSEEPLNHEVPQALGAWAQYREEHRCN